jgi:hypothetical protein
MDLEAVIFIATVVLMAGVGTGSLSALDRPPMLPCCKSSLGGN